MTEKLISQAGRHSTLVLANIFRERRQRNCVKSVKHRPCDPKSTQCHYSIFFFNVTAATAIGVLFIIIVVVVNEILKS